MPVLLEGGTHVSEMYAGSPQATGTLMIWRPFGQVMDARAISMRILKFGIGISPGITNPESDEVFYLLEDLDGDRNQQTCTIYIDGCAAEITRQCGIYLRPRQNLTVENRGPKEMVLVGCQCPESPLGEEFVAPLTHSTSSTQPRLPIVTLDSRRAMPTADRWYRVLIDEEVGSEQVTQFVGSIPPGRAPDHFHDYEEVLFILRGKGRMWAGPSSTPIGVGSCIYLPRGQVHCVENTGRGELRLMGVFYPAGSPAVRYDA